MPEQLDNGIVLPEDPGLPECGMWVLTHGPRVHWSDERINVSHGGTSYRESGSMDCECTAHEQSIAQFMRCSFAAHAQRPRVARPSM